MREMSGGLSIMRVRLLLDSVMAASMLALLGTSIAGRPVLAGPAQQVHLNPVIDLLQQHKPVFGLYAPSNRRHGAAVTSEPRPTPLEMAKETVAYRYSDYLFDGSMEHDYSHGLQSFSAYAQALHDVAPVQRSASTLKYPLVVKMHPIGSDYDTATRHIGEQLDLGVTSVIFVQVESAEELRRGIAAMRYREHGGTRADRVGVAPARWGLSDREYRRKADVWPLNPEGELVVQAIVESKEGLKNLREIAAVKGIGVLFPGAGSLRAEFSTTGADGKRTLDEAAWEGAIQQVLAACREFDVPCGYPANEKDIELRMQQGFSVFIIGWGEPGFRAVDIGRRLGGRTTLSE